MIYVSQINMYYYTITFKKMQVSFKKLFLNYRIEKIYSVILFFYYSATNAPANNGSILIPGPIVNEIATVLKYCPFEAAGFNLII